MAEAALPLRVLSKDELESLAYRMPSYTDKVYKDECMFCFRTPLHGAGLFVCLKTFAGFCVDHVGGHYQRSAQTAFLLIKQTKEPSDETADEPKDKVTKLAIGVGGGFCSSPKLTVKENTYFVVYPFLQAAVDRNKMCADLQKVIKEVEINPGAFRAQQLEAGVSSWDGEAKIATKHLNLTQLDNGVKVPASGWKCEAPGCDLQENLWLNLTDGAIKCGRTQFCREGVMTTGNNHMSQHFAVTGFPLVVKLGTIGDGTADVYSYDEDESVIDPNLEEHLRHFGIDLHTAVKTEKSTLELELDLNQKWEWAVCQEDGENLEAASGPAFVGMVNLGSSCYLNASIQLLCLVSDFTKVYADGSENFFSSVIPEDSADDFDCQTAKLFAALETGDASMDTGCTALVPKGFRRVIGKGHPEFSTAKQQDAEEFIRYFLSKVDGSVSDAGDNRANPVDAVRFKLETRFEDVASGRVRYSEKEELILQVTIPPVKPAVPNLWTSEPARSSVGLDACLAATFSEATIDGFRSPITNEVGGAKQSHRFATFPDFLLIQLNRFYFDDDMKCKKMDVDVLMDTELDLAAFKAQGVRPGEELLPEDAQLNTKPKAPRVDEGMVDALVSMGFPAAMCRRAVYMTKNASIEEAMDWMTAHIDDPDVMKEHPDLVSSSKEVDSGIVEQLSALGFSRAQARYAIEKCTSHDVNTIAEWLFSHPDAVPPPEEPSKSYSPAATKPNCRNGSPLYSLVGFISHMGSSPHSGHYVAHLKKNETWYLYNDEKVALSKKPPFSHGYVYLYRRRDL